MIDCYIVSLKLPWWSRGYQPLHILYLYTYTITLLGLLMTVLDMTDTFFRTPSLKKAVCFFKPAVTVWSFRWLAVQSVYIVIKVVSLSPSQERCTRYNICDRSVVSSTNKTDHHDITEILWKMVLNTITRTLI